MKICTANDSVASSVLQVVTVTQLSLHTAS